jgi:hypothetical protein
MYSGRLGTVEDPPGRQVTAVSVPWRLAASPVTGASQEHKDLSKA